MTSEAVQRWAGRHAGKDALRAEIWNGLLAEGVAVGPTWSRIPNFVGADLAAKRLAQLPSWQRARVIKCNPDPPQIPLRLRALYEGKVVLAPVPELTAGYPYVRLDPVRLQEKGISFELAATSQGYVQHGEPLHFREMPRLDFCVVGCVAVTRAGGRTGKGAGFADLETGIFRELGLIDDTTPLATTVHSSQLVADERAVMVAHDYPLDFIATELELVTTGTTLPRPKGVDWEAVQPDQYSDIPFLADLRRELERR